MSGVISGGVRTNWPTNWMTSLIHINFGETCQLQWTRYLCKQKKQAKKETTAFVSDKEEDDGRTCRIVGI